MTEATIVQVHPDPDSMLFTCRWPVSTSARPTSPSWAPLSRMAPPGQPDRRSPVWCWLVD
jgi:hypothetical protein